MVTGNRKKTTKPPKGVVGGVSFFKSRSLPFCDGYDMERNRQEVADVIALAESGKEIEFDHPLHDAYLLYLDRLRDFNRMMQDRQAVAEAESQMSRQEARKYRALGALQNDADDEDELVLHTKEAFQLFTGRANDPDQANASRIISFKKVGAAYRQLWNLSSNNNPYADWALLNLSSSRDSLHESIVESTKTLEATLEKMAQQRGLRFSVSKSATPQPVPIRFKSPYGYQLVETLAEFDYVVRVIRTMVFKGRLTTPAADQLIRLHMRQFRAHFNEVKKFEKYLTDAELVLLTRNDFLPMADDVARARVAKCVDLFGAVPRSVFEMKEVPQFKSHRSDVTEAELALLRKVTAGVSEHEGDETTLVSKHDESEGLM